MDAARPDSLFLDALLQPAGALLDPGRRVFWVFLAGAGVIAAATLLVRGVSAHVIAGRLLSPRVWLHRSARLDYKLIVVKALLRALLLGPLGLSALAVAALSAGWLRRHLGTPDVQVPAPFAGLILTLCAFLAEDFSRFYVHRLMHRVPLLWELHKVHHSAEVLTPFTLYRTHPIEALLNGLRGAAAIGLVTGACAWLFGPGLRAFEVLGVDAIGFVWTLLGANLRHSHVWVSYGRRAEHLLLSPAQHQIHHSSDPRHMDSNFGTVLALWDWLSGSLYVPARRERLRFGLPPKDRDREAEAHDSVFGALVLPVVAALRRAAPGWPAVALGAALLSIGCTEKRLDRAALLTSFARCTTGTYESFQGRADGLAAATMAAAADPEAGLAAARAAWTQAIDTWQRVDLLRYGPAADFETLGGKGLRQEIYAWPDVNRCLIEEQIVSRVYEGAGLASLSNSTRGLAAIEYLLFYPGADNACAPTSPINMTGSWAALTPDELSRRKMAYAAAAAADVARRARALLLEWGAEQGGFQQQLTEAGRGSKLFPTQQAALSAVAEGLFHLDTDLKDRKLAAPLGLDAKVCASGPCPEALESQWAGRTREHLRGNLAGAELLLLGCPAGEGLGYDDLLEAVGAPALASQARADLAAANAAVDALPGDGLAQALVKDPEPLRRVHAAVKEMTDFLKMEFSMTLSISSKRVEGDHD